MPWTLSPKHASRFLRFALPSPSLNSSSLPPQLLLIRKVPLGRRRPGSNILWSQTQREKERTLKLFDNSFSLPRSTKTVMFILTRFAGYWCSHMFLHFFPAPCFPIGTTWITFLDPAIYTLSFPKRVIKISIHLENVSPTHFENKN